MKHNAYLIHVVVLTPTFHHQTTVVAWYADVINILILNLNNAINAVQGNIILELVLELVAV